MVCCLQSLTSTSPRPHISNCTGINGRELRGAGTERPCARVRKARRHLPSAARPPEPLSSANTDASAKEDSRRAFPFTGGTLPRAVRALRLTASLKALGSSYGGLRHSGVQALSYHMLLYAHTQPPRRIITNCCAFMRSVDSLIREKNVISHYKQSTFVCKFTYDE